MDGFDGFLSKAGSAADLFLDGDGWRQAASGVEGNSWSDFVKGLGRGVTAASGVGALGSGAVRGVARKLGSAGVDAAVSGGSAAASSGGRAAASSGGSSGLLAGPGRAAPAGPDYRGVSGFREEPRYVRARESLPDYIDAGGPTGFGAVDGRETLRFAEQLAERTRERGPGFAGMERGEIAEMFLRNEEFRGLLAANRMLMTSNQLQTNAARSTASKMLRPVPFAEMSGLSIPRNVANKGEWHNSIMRAVARKDDLKAAEQLADQFSNLSAMFDNLSPSFYRTYQSILENVESVTGFPRIPLNVSLSTASAQAAPYMEALRFARIVPFVKTVNGRAVFDEAAAVASGIKSSDSFILNTGRALAESVNNPDFLSRKIVGQAMKTNSYTINRHNTDFLMSYVADTVDGGAQYLIGKPIIKGGVDAVDMSSPAGSLYTQFAGRLLSEIYGVPPAWVQEVVWRSARGARDGSRISVSKGGVARGDAIPAAFTGNAGDTRSVLVNAVQELDPAVVKLARENVALFEDGVSRGVNPNWVWSADANMPLPRDRTALIVADKRNTKFGSKEIASRFQEGDSFAKALQEKILEGTMSLGEDFSSKVFALSLSTGIPAYLLMQYILELDGLSINPEISDESIVLFNEMDEREGTAWL